MALTKIPGNLIATGAVTGDVLADGGIATAKLANDAVTTDKILDANITHAKLHTSMDLTGKTVTVATASGSTNTTAAASTAFVQQELTTLIGGAPGTLDTLNELAAAINDDANYNTTLTTALATKLPLAGGTMTGDLRLSDGVELELGDNAEFKIKHHASGYTHLENTVGTLYIDSDSVTFRDDDGSPTNLLVNQTGISVTGDITTTVDGNAYQLYYTESRDFITHSGATAVIKQIDNDTNNAKINFNAWDNSTIMTVMNSGNVGIGTASPAQKLDVNGKIRFTPNTADTNYSADIGARYDSAHPFELSVKNNGSSAEYFGVYADAGGANNRVVFPTGNVGIGETVPQSKLHVKSGDSGGTVYNAGYNPLVIETPSHGGIQILTPNNRNGLIYFGDSDNAVIGRIEYLHSTDTFEFVTAGVSRLLLNNVSLSSTVKITAPSFIPSTGYNIEYLIVGGGGGGGTTIYDDCGGGGAGGYRSSIAGNPSANYGPPEPPLLAVVGKTYAVTVGAGGNLLGSGNPSGFGLIQSEGGGRAGNHRSRGHPGGSGGGGSGKYISADNVEGGVGYYGQGNDGGTMTNYSAAGGGGGAGAPGEGGTGSSKAGGAGVWSVVESGINLHIGSQTSNRVYRAGGGGAYGGGAGGNGGGGRGWSTSQTPTAGAANTGGGGGGNKENHANSATVGGGSGIVILKVPTSNYTGTTTGSPTVTTVGSYKILKFTSSGSYTA